jgi:IclR family acetate operon transcriptional repressor
MQPTRYLLCGAQAYSKYSVQKVLQMFNYEHNTLMKEYHIPNLGKACDVLQLISGTTHGCTLNEISKTLGIPRTTALRITQTLQKADFLAKKDDGAFVLGSTVIQLGVKALDSIDIRGYARPVLQKLACDINESTHLAMLSGKKSMLVEVYDCPHPVRIAARPGTMVDLHSSATGKVFLAYCFKDPESFCRQLELSPHTPNTQNTLEKVLAGIRQTRKNGYAIDEEEYLLGVRCIAAPVMNAFGKTVDAIGLTASAATFTKARIPVIATRIKSAAAEISARLGCTR